MSRSCIGFTFRPGQVTHKAIKAELQADMYRYRGSGTEAPRRNAGVQKEIFPTIKLDTKANEIQAPDITLYQVIDNKTATFSSWFKQLMQ